MQKTSFLHSTITITFTVCYWQIISICDNWQEFGWTEWISFLSIFDSPNPKQHSPHGPGTDLTCAIPPSTIAWAEFYRWKLVSWPLTEWLKIWHGCLPFFLHTMQYLCEVWVDNILRCMFFWTDHVIFTCSRVNDDKIIITSFSIIWISYRALISRSTFWAYNMKLFLSLNPIIQNLY